jgi:flagellar P-ring protein FlgI
MSGTLRLALAALTMFVCAASTAGATSRIKDLANVEGIRQNQLIGYGLVAGLNGTGDTLNNTPFTKQSLQGMLERLGINIRGQQIRTGNVAAVMVTANLPPFGTQGTRIDVTASAMGDAKSLLGGTLLVTPLLGADGNVYAVAQGSLAIGGFQVEGEAAKITRGVPTVGRLPNGAIIEREIEFTLGTLGQLRLSLRNPDFTTASASPSPSTTIWVRRSPSRSIRRRCSSRCRRSFRRTWWRCSPRSSSSRSSRMSPPRSS